MSRLRSRAVLVAADDGGRVLTKCPSPQAADNLSRPRAGRHVKGRPLSHRRRNRWVLKGLPPGAAGEDGMSRSRHTIRIGYVAKESAYLGTLGGTCHEDASARAVGDRGGPARP